MRHEMKNRNMTHERRTEIAIKAMKTVTSVFIMAAVVLLCSCRGSDGTLALNGIVADDPLVGADVVVYGPDSEILGITTTNNAGEYWTNVPYESACRVVVSGGTIGGIPFAGTMESICDGTQTCHVTPLTTLAAVLVDVYGLSLSQARAEVQRTCGVSEGEDPFVLEQQGRADESVLIQLESMRARLGNSAENMDTWLSEMLDCVPEPYAGIVIGTVEVIGSLGGSAIEVIDNNGEIFEAVTDDDGYWETSASTIINSDFRVEARGGLDFSEEFDGTLSACVAYDGGIDLAGTPIRLTILSTLIDRYMQHSGRTYDDAVQAVKEFLSIPEEIGLEDDMIGAYFSPFEFMDRSEDDSGFDAFVDGLVLRIDSGENISIGGPANEYEIIKVPFSGKVLNGVLGGAGSAGTGFLLNSLVTLVGPAVGYYTPEQITAQRFEEIQNTLASMSTQLSGLENQLATLTSNLDMATNEIISHVYSASANSAAARIKARFAEYTSLAGPQALPVFFADMANSASELKNDLTEIDTSLFQPAIGTGSGLEYLVSSLEEKVRLAAFGDEKNLVLYNAYKTLETIYTQAMTIQVQGTALLKSKFDYEDEGDLTRSESYLNGILRPRFVNQTEKFLVFVERLVAASADVRTFVTGGISMFPSCTTDIFHEADLLAREFLEDHDYGFVVHIAGDPKSISEYCGSPTGRDWGPATFVPTCGNDTRDYAAPLPQDASYYLGWNLDRNTRWHLSKETKIRFAKLRFAEIESRLAGIAPKTVTYCFPYNQVTQVDFERIEPADIPYAHCFVTARAVPVFNFKNENIVTTYEYTSYPVPKEHRADLHSTTLTARYGRGQQCNGLWIDTRADMFLEIINDAASAVTLRLSGAVEEKITNDTGGMTPNASQDLHWQVKVGGDTMFSHEYHYDVDGLPWNHLRTFHIHTYTTETGGTARWEAGGTLDKMRQVYFRVSKACSAMNNSPDLEHVDTIFKTTLNRLEITPAD